jgi:hypothetical protein
VASFHAAAGDRLRAVRLMEKVLAARRRALGDDHPATAARLWPVRDD